MLDYLLGILDRLPDEQQISVLIIAATNLAYLYGMIAESAEFLKLGHDRLIVKLVALKDKFDAVSVLKWNAICTTEQIKTIVTDIMISAPQLRSIEFVFSCGDVYDENNPHPDVCTVNIFPSDIPDFIRPLLTNRSILECDIKSTYDMKPFVHLVNKILKLNTKIAASTSDIVKDKIYNRYVPIINKQIKDLKTKELVDEEFPIVKLIPQQMYSLRSLAAFFINHSHPSTSGATSSHDLGEHIRDLSDQTRLPEELIKKDDVLPKSPGC